jgi:hypothetical protein
VRPSIHASSGRSLYGQKRSTFRAPAGSLTITVTACRCNQQLHFYLTIASLLEQKTSVTDSLCWHMFNPN